MPAQSLGDLHLVDKKGQQARQGLGPMLPVGAEGGGGEWTEPPGAEAFPLCEELARAAAGE